MRKPVDSAIRKFSYSSDNIIKIENEIQYSITDKSKSLLDDAARDFLLDFYYCLGEEPRQLIAEFDGARKKTRALINNLKRNKAWFERALGKNMDNAIELLNSLKDQLEHQTKLYDNAPFLSCKLGRRTDTARNGFVKNLLNIYKTITGKKPGKPYIDNYKGGGSCGYGGPIMRFLELTLNPVYVFIEVKTPSNVALGKVVIKILDIDKKGREI